MGLDGTIHVVSCSATSKHTCILKGLPGLYLIINFCIKIDLFSKIALIEKQSEPGHLQCPVGITVNEDLIYVNDYKHGQFNEPVDVDVDNEGFVYVTDSGNNCVQKFTPDGQFVCSFGEKQSEPGHLQWPVGITVNEDLIYAYDASDYITVYNKNSGMYCCRIGLNLIKKGHGGALVVGVTVDQYGYLIVCCYCDGQIKIF